MTQQSIDKPIEDFQKRFRGERFKSSWDSYKQAEKEMIEYDKGTVYVKKVENLFLDKSQKEICNHFMRTLVLSKKIENALLSVVFDLIKEIK